MRAIVEPSRHFLNAIDAIYRTEFKDDDCAGTFNFNVTSSEAKAIHDALQAERDLMDKRDPRPIALKAIDALGTALASTGMAWTSDLRKLYEDAVKSFEDSESTPNG